MSQERCLQLSTGSCAGCNVLKIADNKLKDNCKPVDQVIESIQAEYCPSGLKLQAHQVRAKNVIRSMGQPKR